MTIEQIKSTIQELHRRGGTCTFSYPDLCSDRKLTKITEADENSFTYSNMNADRDITGYNQGKNSDNLYVGGIRITDIAYPGPSIDQIRSSLITALTAKKDVEIDYTDVDGDKTTRVVTPEHIFISAEGEQLKGRCHLRDAVRSFKLDRIAEVREPKPEPTYRYGERICIRPDYGGEFEATLVQCSHRKVIAVTDSGNRWHEPTTVADVTRITASEMKSIVGHPCEKISA